MLTLFAGCSGGQEGKPVLKVLNWGDYIGEGVIEDFEEEFGVEVIYDMFEQNEDMYTKLKTASGNASYDVVIPSDYMIQRMISEDMLEKIDVSAIPNFSLIDDKFKDLAFDPGNQYSVPYMWGTVGIIYNTTMIDEEVNSWSILWDQKYAKNMFMMNSVRDSMGIALKYLGYSMNTDNMDEITEAQAALIAQKPLLLGYTGDEIKDKMIAGEAALAVIYSGDAITCIDQNDDLAYAVPEEGTNVWFDNMCVVKGSQNIELAQQFINFMCRTDIAQRNNEYINYSTPQIEVYEGLSDDLKNDPLFYPSDDILDKCEVYEDLGDMVKVYDDMWTEVIIS